MDLEMDEETGVYTSLDCGCLEKMATIGMVSTIMHLEPDGSGEAYITTGDWEDEITFPDCTTIEDLEKRTEDYIYKLPVEG